MWVLVPTSNPTNQELRLPSVAVLESIGDSIFSCSHPISASHLCVHRDGSGCARRRDSFIVPKASDPRYLERRAAWFVRLPGGFRGVRFLGSTARFRQL
jgi:hypothetical protein